MAILYIVATPIGNLQDITLRALETLKTADVIGCEDTRHTRKLLSAFDIHKPLVTCNAHKERSEQYEILTYLNNGQNAAYVTDSGTPGLSDPGTALVRRVREEGHTVLPVPGASAVTALASLGGFPGKTLIFEGFLSPKQGRRKKELDLLLKTEKKFILFESPFRILKLLADIKALDPLRLILLGREMTKQYEEYREGTAGELYEYLEKKDRIRGEFSLLVSGNKKS